VTAYPLIRAERLGRHEMVTSIQRAFEQVASVAVTPVGAVIELVVIEVLAPAEPEKDAQAATSPTDTVLLSVPARFR
jgi:hypothetical protein